MKKNLKQHCLFVVVYLSLYGFYYCLSSKLASFLIKNHLPGHCYELHNRILLLSYARYLVSLIWLFDQGSVYLFLENSANDGCLLIAFTPFQWNIKYETQLHYILP